LTDQRSGLRMSLPKLERKAMKTAILAAVSLLFAADLSAQEHAIDTKQSTLTIHVGKAGMFSALGHEHEIRGTISGGSAETGAHPSVEVHVNARELTVIDRDESEKARTEVQSTMLGPEVLDSGRFNDIVFKSTSAESTGDRQWTLHGDLSLRGQTRPVTVRVTLKDGRYAGEAIVKQTDFGIKPPGMAGVRATDEVRIEFEVQLAL
jgi:polyisoprenoid-binding protein YceI